MNIPENCRFDNSALIGKKKVWSRRDGCLIDELYCPPEIYGMVFKMVLKGWIQYIKYVHHCGFCENFHLNLCGHRFYFEADKNGYKVVYLNNGYQIVAEKR